MKVERGNGDSSVRRIAEAVAAQPYGGAATVFATALRQHQQRQVSHREEPRRPDEGSSRRTAGRQAAQRDVSGGSKDTHCTDSTSDESMMPIEPPRLLSLLPACGEHASQAPTGAAAHRDIRRRRNAGDTDASPCIEITHARTEARFLLSRIDGVWVLSLHGQPAMNPTDLQSVLETLRAHFAERGLGPIDIIV